MLCLGISCSENAVEEIDKLPKDRSKYPVSISKNMHLHLSDSAVKKVEIKTSVLERYDNAKPPFNKMPKGIHVQFLDSLGETEATVDANFATHYPEKQELVLENNVIIINKKGEKLNSEHVTWNAETHQISSNDFVKITTEDQIIYGDGFIANEDFTDYQINHIKGIVAIETDEEPEEIASDTNDI
jgi:LPS export ABC transporter protein LptC